MSASPYAHSGQGNCPTGVGPLSLVVRAIATRLGAPGIAPAIGPRARPSPTALRSADVTRHPRAADRRPATASPGRLQRRLEPAAVRQRVGPRHEASPDVTAGLRSARGSIVQLAPRANAANCATVTSWRAMKNVGRSTVPWPPVGDQRSLSNACASRAGSAPMMNGPAGISTKSEQRDRRAAGRRVRAGRRAQPAPTRASRDDSAAAPPALRERVVAVTAPPTTVFTREAPAVAARAGVQLGLGHVEQVLPALAQQQAQVERPRIGAAGVDRIEQVDAARLEPRLAGA